MMGQFVREHVRSERRLVLLWMIVAVSWCTGHSEAAPKVFGVNEICGVYNGHRVYLELGDRGQLQATNVTVPEQSADGIGSNETNSYVCSLELVTCPSCSLKISLSYSNFPTKCTTFGEPPCRCDYLQFSEPPYEDEQLSRRSCGHDVVYQTQTRSVQIRFVYRSNHAHAFTLEYVAERNRETLQANPGQSGNATGSHNKVIATPYFPSYYPRDFGKEYVLSCNIDACRINVIFSDFQLAKTSTMEFYDWNGQRLSAVSGSIFRPPVVQSTGPSMIIRFYANGGSGLGYRARVSFITPASAVDVRLTPNTNCGGAVENIGGAITMMKMLESPSGNMVFDCIWLIKPPNTYAHLKTHLSLRIDTFENMGAHSRLTIIQGVTSDNAVIDIVKTGSTVQDKSYVVPLTSGFYLHLRASFEYKSRLALVYTAFSYLDCFMGTEFLCQNRKCIPIQLHCDGFDHCGDNSDEPDSCTEEWIAEHIDRRWYSHTPNYYFPKVDRYPDLRMATIIFIASSLGLIMLISALIVLLYRTGNRARQQRELQSQLQTISELLDSNTRGSDDVDEPPVYEAPPEYDEIIKIGMEGEIRRKRRRHSSSASGRRSRLSRSRRQSNVSDVHNPILEVQLPSESYDTPTTSHHMDQGDFETAPACDPFSDDDCEDDRRTNWSSYNDSDFFVTSRILENSAAPTAGQSFNVGCTTSANVSASPPPSYDQDHALFCSIPEAINPCGLARADDEETSTVAFAVNATQQPSSVSPPQTVPHWHEPHHDDRSWHAFETIPAPTILPTVQSFDSVDRSQIHEIDAYLLAYRRVNDDGVALSPTSTSSSQETLNSNRTLCSQLPSTASSFVRQPCTCPPAEFNGGNNGCTSAATVYHHELIATRGPRPIVVVCRSCGGIQMRSFQGPARPPLPTCPCASCTAKRTVSCSSNPVTMLAPPSRALSAEQLGDGEDERTNRGVSMRRE